MVVYGGYHLQALHEFIEAHAGIKLATEHNGIGCFPVECKLGVVDIFHLFDELCQWLVVENDDVVFPTDQGLHVDVIFFDHLRRPACLKQVDQ